MPHTIAMTATDVNNRNGTLLRLLRNDEKLSQVRDVLVDGSYIRRDVLIDYARYRFSPFNRMQYA